MSEKTLANNKRIAKNTMLLYLRMLLLMIISLYTSRVVINELGVIDYGIYSVVGGVVTMFSILSSSLSAAISRFITFELGKSDYARLNKVFCTSVNVQIALIIIISLLLETVGLWFINHKMVIPDDRLFAANWVFQFSVLTFAIALWSVPYNSLIIAHERMNAFAYISLFDAFSKLLIAFFISRSPIDDLIFYSFLMVITTIIQQLLYVTYCRRNFNESRYVWIFDKLLTKEIFRFAGWNFIGASSVILRDQGGNIIINLFDGPAINAARSVAMSVNKAVSGFANNFMTALNPQITKNYASGDFTYMFSLMFQGARLSYYILFIIAFPIILTAPYLLKLWLGIVPDHASNFTCLVLIFALSECLAGPLITAMLASGHIKKYQLIVGGLQLLNLPLSFVCLKLGFPSESIFIIAIIISFLCEFLRLILLRQMIGLSIIAFFHDVYFNVILVSIVAFILPYIVRCYIGIEIFSSFFIISCVSFFSAIMSIYLVGCNKHDKEIINGIIKKIIRR